MTAPYYFTFGTDPAFPYGIKDYVLVYGKDRHNCAETFRKKYPNRPGSNVLNCADYYSQKEWENGVKDYYKNTHPKKVLLSDAVYGSKSEGFDHIWFYVPSQGDVIWLQRHRDGEREYLNVRVFELDYDDVRLSEDSEVQFDHEIEGIYECLAATIPDVLGHLYGETLRTLDALILPQY